MRDNRLQYVHRLSQFDSAEIEQKLVDAIDRKIDIGICVEGRTWVVASGEREGESTESSFVNLAPETLHSILMQYQAINGSRFIGPEVFMFDRIETIEGDTLVPDPLFQTIAGRALDKKDFNDLEKLADDPSFKYTKINFWFDDLFLCRELPEQSQAPVSDQANIKKKGAVKGPDLKRQNNDLMLLGALFSVIKGEGAFKNYEFKSKKALIEDIARYYGDRNGLGEPTLREKLTFAKLRAADEILVDMLEAAENRFDGD